MWPDLTWSELTCALNWPELTWYELIHALNWPEMLLDLTWTDMWPKLTWHDMWPELTWHVTWSEQLPYLQDLFLRCIREFPHQGCSHHFGHVPHPVPVQHHHRWKQTCPTPPQVKTNPAWLAEWVSKQILTYCQLHLATSGWSAGWNSHNAKISSIKY